MGVSVMKLKKSLRKLIKRAKTQILRAVLSLAEEVDPVNLLISIAYFGAFSGLIISLCLMGVNGDVFWGIMALINALVVLFVGIVTGAF